jgi:polyhydroxyalkanoate synthesis repressor PhaR
VQLTPNSPGVNPFLCRCTNNNVVFVVFIFTIFLYYYTVLNSLMVCKTAGCASITPLHNANRDLMKTTETGQKEALNIRKYSNRRYYDATHGRHLTLEEIRDLVKAGHGVRVTDNATGTDITTKVLAQIILDLDAPKLEMFPAAFLAEIIRVNDQLLKGFYEKFFHQALRYLLDYQQLIQSQIKQGGGLPAMFPPMTGWTQAMMTPFGISQAETNPPSATSQPPPSEDLAATLANLQQQVSALQSQLPKPGKPNLARSRAKRAKVR